MEVWKSTYDRIQKLNFEIERVLVKLIVCNFGAIWVKKLLKNANLSEFD
jgi:hypothetical protein